MVSFVCDRCQDTVKKPKLDQHANSCGGPFSCVDCSVSFQDTDYRAHTSCISEAEKYQKALYKGPKSKPATPAPKAKAEEVEEAPVSEKKLSKEEKKKLKAEKKASKGGEEDKMEVDEPEAVEAASPEPASEKKLSKEEKKKLKAEKKSGKTEEKAEEKTESSKLPEALGAQLRKLEATKAEGKDASGVSDIAAAAAAAGLVADDIEAPAANVTEKSKKKDKKREREEDVAEEKAKSPEPEKKKKSKKENGEVKVDKAEKVEKVEKAEAQRPLPEILGEKALEVLKSGKTDLVSFKKQIDATFGSKPERKSAGYNGESFDKTAHVEVKDGAIVLTFA